MKVYLMQHGKPVPKEIDPDRPLSDKGKSDVKRMAEFLKGKINGISKAYHSGKTRAQQTAEIFISNLGISVDPVKREGLAPLDDVTDIANELKTSDENIFIAGHLPHLGKLVSLLISGDSEKGVVQFQQGGIVCCERQEQGWIIRWMLIHDILD